MKQLNYYQAIAILIGTVIGAGVLGIPKIIADLGLVAGIIEILLLGGLVLITNLFLGEIVLSFKTCNQLTGYAEKILGKKGKTAMAISMIGGIYGALLAYIIVEGRVLGAIFNINPFLVSIVFFMAAAIAVYLGISFIKSSELIMSSIILGIILLLAILSLPFISLTNITPFNIIGILPAYGVILFAFLGAAAIPEMRICLAKQKQKLKSAIIIGSIIPFIIYAIFAIVVVLVTGLSTTEVATIGLGETIGLHMVLLGNLFAAFAMATSFLVLGLALKDMYHLDYKINHFVSWLLACFPSFILFIVGIRSFTKTIGITGAVAGGLEGFLIVFMHWKLKAKRKPEYKITKSILLGLIIMTVYIIGAVYSIYALF